MTSPVSLPSGSKITAAKLDAYENLTAFWTPYVPTLTSSSGSPDVSNGTLTGRYRQVGKTVDLRIALTRGSSTSFGTGFISLSLPVTALDASQAGACALNDSGTNTFAGSVILEDASKLTPVSASGVITSTSPFTWATGDRIVIAVTYEAA